MTHRSFKLTPLALILVALALVGAGCGNEEAPTVNGENTATQTDEAMKAEKAMKAEEAMKAEKAMKEEKAMKAKESQSGGSTTDEN